MSCRSWTVSLRTRWRVGEGACSDGGVVADMPPTMRVMGGWHAHFRSRHGSVGSTTIGSALALSGSICGMELMDTQPTAFDDAASLPARVQSCRVVMAAAGLGLAQRRAIEEPLCEYLAAAYGVGLHYGEGLFAEAVDCRAGARASLHQQLAETALSYDEIIEVERLADDEARAACDVGLVRALEYLRQPE
jgi:hypothetical protein